MDAETAELAALGIRRVGARRRPGCGTDPKSMIGVFNAAERTALPRRSARPRHRPRRARAEPANALRRSCSRMPDGAGRYREAIASYKVPGAGAVSADSIIASRSATRGSATSTARSQDEAALAIDPRASDARMLRGGLLASRGRIEDGLKELRAAVEIDPGNASFHVGLARVLITARRYEEASSEVVRALDLQPGNPVAQATSGTLLMAQGQPDRAVEAFQRALRIDEDQDDVRLDLARALEQAGRGAAAQAEYRRLAEGRETPPEIRRAARDRLRR